jgi:hypothetical protein
MTFNEGLGGPEFDKLPDGVKRQLMGMAANAMMSRAQLVQSMSSHADRDIDAECGYPPGPIGAQYYQELYDRGDIPARVVELYPHECWQVSPSVYETEEPDNETPFETAWDELGQSLRAEDSWHSGEMGSVVWEYLHRVDVLSGIGQYAVVLLGLDDGAPLDEPAPLRKAGGNGAEGKGGTPRKLIYARVFPETLAKVTQLEQDYTSPRFGHPTEYEITFIDPGGQGVGAPEGKAGQGAPGPGLTTRMVHWSRVVHVADNRRENEVFGVPRMQQVVNRLLDLRKVYGGSGEMYYKGAFPGYSIETWPQLGWDVDIDEEKTKDMMWRWQNGLQRWIQLTGQSIKGLSPQVVDPSGQIEKQLEAICIKLGCPVRIFKGSERGELASSQDDTAWNDRLKHRQGGYLTPRLIVPFVDRLIALGVLPPPEQYFVWWPDLTSKSDSEKAAIAAQRTTAVVQYVGASANNIQATLAPVDFWTRIMGFDDEEAQAIVDNGEEEKKRLEEEAKKAQAEADAAAQKEHQRALELAQANKPPPAPNPPDTGPQKGGQQGSPQGGQKKDQQGGQGNSTLPPGNVADRQGTGSTQNYYADNDLLSVACWFGEQPLVNYDPTQPRVSAGSPEGGEFRGTGGSLAGSGGVLVAGPTAGPAPLHYDASLSNPQIDTFRRRNSNAKLVEITLTDKQLKKYRQDYEDWKKHNSQDAKRVEGIGGAKSVPPIVAEWDVNQWLISDGAHRAALSAAAGQRRLLAWVPADSPIANADNTRYVYWNYMEDRPLTRNAKKQLPTGGRWVTILGRKVYIKGGKVLAGPKAIKEAIEKKGDKGAGKKSDHHDAFSKEKVAESEKKVKAAAWWLHGKAKKGKDEKGKDKGGKDKRGKDDKPAPKAPVFTKHEDRAAAAEYADKTHGKWADKLSKKQVKALEDYGDDEHYQSINSGLRRGKVPKEYTETVKHLDEAIDSAPPSKAEMTLFRGVGAGVADKLKVGGEFVDHGYTSTSHNKHVASNFAEDAMIQITAPKGTKMASVDASRTSFNIGKTSENEYILPRGTKYRVTGKKKDADSGLTVYHVEVI